jgi:hypothetical protein
MRERLIGRDSKRGERERESNKERERERVMIDEYA